MTINNSNTVAILSDTMRSRVYAQALHNAGIRLNSVLIIYSKEPKWGQSKAACKSKANLGDLFVPDLSIPLIDSVQRICSDIHQFSTGTLNSTEVIEWLKGRDEDIAIFSGFGGEIIREDVLNAGLELLHLHSGWLPDFRGSTTAYYSILSKGKIGVSAIFLRKDIDTGPILAKKYYPIPPIGVDIDYTYDSVLRADLLTQVLNKHLSAGTEALELSEQNPDAGCTYYIIHPVLKHIALNKVKRTKILSIKR